MKKKSPNIGSSFESWLDEIGIREEVTAAAIKAIKERLARKNDKNDESERRKR